MILWICLDLILLLLSIWIASTYFNMLFRGFAPFISINQKAIKLILDEINPTADQIVLELGCGRAKFLQQAHKRFPDIKMVGYEYSFVPFLIAKLILWIQKSPVIVHRQNIFYVNLQEADFIYFYLLPTMLPRVREKLRSECRAGTMIMSYMFAIPEWTPKKILKQGINVFYIYEV